MNDWQVELFKRSYDFAQQALQARAAGDFKEAAHYFSTAAECMRDLDAIRAQKAEKLFYQMFKDELENGAQS